MELEGSLTVPQQLPIVPLRRETNRDIVTELHDRSQFSLAQDVDQSYKCCHLSNIFGKLHKVTWQLAQEFDLRNLSKVLPTSKHTWFRYTTMPWTDMAASLPQY
jgi:hypothetical protein